VSRNHHDGKVKAAMAVVADLVSGGVVVVPPFV
jgi:hypothetical protein